MQNTSSRWRKPKRRANKRSKAIAASIAKKSLQQSVISPDLNSNPCDHDGKEDSKITTSGYIIMSETAFRPLLRNVPCDECGNCTLTVSTGETYGYAVKLELYCESCRKSFGSTFSSQREPYSRKFDVNTKLVSAFLSNGQGHAAMESFSMNMGMATMDSKTFSKCLNQLSIKNDFFKENVLKASCDAVRKAHIVSNPNAKNDDILNISVSYDGTWQKRGHTSLYGIGVVIDSLTNLVVDYEILSKYCPECNASARDLGESSAEFHFWYEGHKSTCQKNFNGSSGSMEMCAAMAIWKRSIERTKMRYTTIISDGDSKTFQSLCDAKVYGIKFPVIKEDCINHVSKRLGTSLRNKIKEWRVKGVTLGGRKQGSLKEDTIVKLQNFYRKAIKDNVPNIVEMKTAVFATLYHCMSTDRKPQHHKCPKGISSWCFYQRALACGEAHKSHTNMKTQLSEKVVEKILPVYQRLASTELLTRCAAGKTQNSNESLHSCIWNKCPKEVFVSKKRLELAVSLAISEFNFGCMSSIKLSKGDNLNKTSELIAHRRDNRRSYQLKRRSSEAYKEQMKKKINDQKKETLLIVLGGFNVLALIYYF